jgi:hypothetical protein
MEGGGGRIFLRNTVLKTVPKRRKSEKNEKKSKLTLASPEQRAYKHRPFALTLTQVSALAASVSCRTFCTGCGRTRGA